MTTPLVSNLKSQILKSWILASSLLLLSAACGRKHETPPAEPGPPPTISSFVLKNLASEFPGEIKTSDYAGQVQLILFFRSDDPACRGSVPGWNALQRDFSGRGFTLVGAIVDDRPVAKVSAEVTALGTAFPVGRADAHVVAAFGGANAIRAIPTAFLLSRDGLVARTYAGHESLQNLRDDIARVLDGQPLPERHPKTGKVAAAQP